MAISTMMAHRLARAGRSSGANMFGLSNAFCCCAHPDLEEYVTESFPEPVFERHILSSVRRESIIGIFPKCPQDQRCS